MNPLSPHAYSYRDDSAVPDFPDDQPLIIFDGVCILCSGFVRFVLRNDRQARFRFATAQSPLGEALFRHYGLRVEDYETNILLEDGMAYDKLAAFARIAGALGGVYRAAWIAAWLPRPVGDWLYDRIAKNRYRLFGRTEKCWAPPGDWQDRFLG